MKFWRDAFFEDAFFKRGTAREMRMVVACFNRLDRIWEVPFFNTLYGQTDPVNDFDLREEFSPFLPAPLSKGVMLLFLDQQLQRAQDYPLGKVNRL